MYDIYTQFLKYGVIANQCAHWCGNPPKLLETIGDCHVGLWPPRNDRGNSNYDQNH